MDNYDFSIDFGIDMEGSDLSDDMFNDNEGVEKGKGVLLTSVIAIVAGFIIILIAFGVINIANRVGDKEINNNVEITDTSDKVLKTNNDVPTSVENDIGSINKEIEKQKNNIFTGGGKSSSSSDGWVEFKPEEGIIFDAVTIAVFEVTGIKHVAKAINNKNDKIIKSIVYGSISGLSGTYEVEVPYDKAILLTNGSEFEIEYRYGIRNGVRLVGEIRY